MWSVGPFRRSHKTSGLLVVAFKTLTRPRCGFDRTLCDYQLIMKLIYILTGKNVKIAKLMLFFFCIGVCCLLYSEDCKSCLNWDPSITLTCVHDVNTYSSRPEEPVQSTQAAHNMSSLLRWDETTCRPIKSTSPTRRRLDDTFDVLISPAGVLQHVGSKQSPLTEQTPACFQGRLFTSSNVGRQIWMMETHTAVNCQTDTKQT